MFSSYLFLKVFKDLMEANIPVRPLLDSKVFCFSFDFDDWPSTHDNDGSYLRPYNDSLFSLRYKSTYESIFPGEEFEDIVDEEGNQREDIETNKVYKIKYTVNILPALSEHCVMEYDEEGKLQKVLKNEGINIMDVCFNTEELDIFDTGSMIDIIEFKWRTFGQFLHQVTLAAHLA